MSTRWTRLLWYPTRFGAGRLDAFIAADDAIIGIDLRKGLDRLLPAYDDGDGVTAQGS